MDSRVRRKRRRLNPFTALLGAVALVMLGVVVPLGGGLTAAASGPTTVGGLPAGTIHHVWLIILENKSYDETFTGLNANSYLWQTLPSEGVLLKNYYGTGHTSQDNYIALASGQGPEFDTQNDCSYADTPFGSNSSIVTTGSVGSASPNWNFGQAASSLGPNASTGTTYNNTTSPPTITATNGCTYPTEVPTLFDQFNAAGVSWKGYAQDLGGAQPIGSTSFVSDSVPGREDAACGAPGSSSNNPVSNPTLLSDSATFPADVSALTSASLVKGTGPSNNNPQYSDQYVAKHFPFPWFASLTGGGAGNPMGTPLTEPQASAGGGTNCDSNHIANLDDPTHGLVADLNANTVPQFSWITPDNCSDAHDTTCKGNNLFGAFGLYTSGPHAGQVDLNDPIYNPPGLPADDPGATTPRNYTGGLYASDLFLAYYLPLIEGSSGLCQRWADRRHLRRGGAVVHLLGEQLQQRADQQQRRERLAGDAGRTGHVLTADFGHARRPELRHRRNLPGRRLDLRCLQHLRRLGRREHQRHQRHRRADRPELATGHRRIRSTALPRSRVQPLRRPAADLHADLAHAGADRLRARNRPR